jgi:omega-amidase
MGNTLKVSIGQFAVQKGQQDANWHTVQDFTAEAKRQGGDVVVFPELWNAGYVLDQADNFAHPLGEGLFADLQALAAKYDIHIVGSIFERCQPGGVANTATLIAPDQEILGAYQKIHLFPLMDEPDYLKAGQQTVSVQAPWGNSALAICYDLRFPELFRRYAIEGAKLAFMPSQWPHPRLTHFRTLVRARAIENQMFMVAVNRIGTDKDTQTHFCGHSMVVDPWGEILIELGENAGVYTVELDLALVDDVRQRIPVLSDRRPELYG